MLWGGCFGLFRGVLGDVFLGVFGAFWGGLLGAFWGLGGGAGEVPNQLKTSFGDVLGYLGVWRGLGWVGCFELFGAVFGGLPWVLWGCLGVLTAVLFSVLWGVSRFWGVFGGLFGLL